MVSKSLELQVTLKGSQAESALKVLVGSMRQADTEQKNMAKSGDKMESQMKQSAAAIEKVATGTSHMKSTMRSYGEVTSRALGGFGKLFSGIRADMNQYIKYAGMAAAATGGIIIGKGFSDFIDFSKAFSLMNATLRASDPKNIKILKDGIEGISSMTGKPIVEITDALTQLYSSGMSPTAAEGTAEYTKQLNDSLKIQELIAKSAMATGEQTRAMGDAYVYATNAIGGDVNSVDNARYVMDLFATTLDKGIGTMDQYTVQFVKFVREAKQAGLSNEEAFAVFSKMTTEMSPDMAAHTTAALMRGINDAPRGIMMGANRMKRALKESIESGTLTKLEAKTLDTDEVVKKWDSIFYKKGKTGENVKKTFTEVMSGITTMLDKTGGKGTKLFDVILSAIGVNVNERRALQALYEKGGSKFFKEGGFLSSFVQQMGTGSAMSSKIEEMNKSFGVQWEVFKQTFNNKVMNTVGMFTPALQGMMGAMVSLMQGGEVSTSSLAEGFAQVRKNVIDSNNAGLLPLVDSLERISTFLVDGRAEKYFEGMKNTAQGALNVIEKIQDAFALLNKLMGWTEELIGGAMWQVEKMTGGESGNEQGVTSMWLSGQAKDLLVESVTAPSKPISFTPGSFLDKITSYKDMNGQNTGFGGYIADLKVALKETLANFNPTIVANTYVDGVNVPSTTTVEGNSRGPGGTLGKGGKAPAFTGTNTLSR